MFEVYKVINGYALPIIDNFFIFREKIHNFRNFAIILNKNKKRVRYGSKTIFYRVPFFLASLPEECKAPANSLNKFKQKIIAGNVYTCLCRLCRPFLQNLGFI